jgi:hypothetical protein
VVSTLWIRVRTSGEESLRRLDHALVDLRVRLHLLANTIRSHLGPHLDRLGLMFRRLGPLGTAMGQAFRGVGSVVGDFADGVGQLVAKLGPMGGAIAFAIPQIVALTSALLNVLPAAQLIAPAILTGVAAFGVFKLATAGVGEAIKAGFSVDTAADVEKFRAALRKLTPSAREFVQVVANLRQEWVPLQKATQQAFFAGVGRMLKSVSDNLKPLAEVWLPDIASKFTLAFQAMANFLTAPVTKGEIEGLLINIRDILGNVLGMIQPLSQAFLDIASVAGPRLADLSGNARTLADAFAEWVRQAKESGKLGDWLDKALTALSTIKDIGGDVGRILGAIFSVGNQGSAQSYLESIRGVTKALADFASSGNGKAAIELTTQMAIISLKAAEFLVKFGSGLVVTAGMIQSHMAAVIAWKNVWVTSIQGMINFFLNFISITLEGAARAFGWIPGIGPKLKQAAAEFQRFRDDVNNWLDGIKNPTKHVYVDVVYNSKDFPAAGSTIKSNVKFFAGGGQARRGDMAVVGESGPELVHFGRDANVMPLKTLSGGSAVGGVVVNNYITAGIGTDGAAVGAQIVNVIKAYERNNGTRWRAA